MFAEDSLSIRIAFRQIYEVEDRQAMGKFQGSLNRVSHPLPGFGLNREPIYDYLNRVLFLLLQQRHFSQCVNKAIDAHPGEPLRLQ